MATITERYLGRLGLNRADAGLDVLLAAHAERIPFEDLDGVAGRPVGIDVGDVAAKLVDQRRGGYCHEHARLAQHALTELGHECLPVLARVHLDPMLTAPMAPTHHLTLVRSGGRWRIFDPGFGGGTPTVTVPVDGTVVTAPGARWRVVPAGPVLGERMAVDSELLLQRDHGQGWSPVYAFTVRRAVAADIEMANWFTATHPDVMFTRVPIAARHLRDGTRLTLRGTTVRRTEAGEEASREIAERGEFAAVLRGEFLIEPPEPVLAAAWRAAVSG